MADNYGMPLRARRTHSLPSKYMLPSADMGEYESPTRRRSAPEREKPASGGLYPLNEQGEYGQPPRALPPPPPFKRRELKPKVYSSYSVDPSCDLHSKKLSKSARDYSADNTRKISTSSVGSRVSSRSSMSPAPERRIRMVSASPSRAPSERSYNGRTSRSPEPFPQTLRKSYDQPRNFSALTGAPTQRFPTTFNSQKFRESSQEENDDYSYAENRISTGIMKSTSSNKYSSSYSSFSSGNSVGNNKTDFGRNISLDALRKPKVVSWDSMGILGLSNKMWSDTKKRQESFMESTGRFIREETYNSYIM